MKKSLSYILSTGFIAFLLVYFGFLNTKEQPNNVQPVGQSTKEIERWETKTDAQPPVTVSITPVEFGKNTAVWKFDIAFNTHSGSLDDDPLQIAVLADNQGRIYQPTAWEGPGPGGHHREGTLIFDAISPMPPYIELKIKDVGGIPERLFKWGSGINL